MRTAEMVEMKLERGRMITWRGMSMVTRRVMRKEMKIKRGMIMGSRRGMRIIDKERDDNGN
jgi:hypothetical protein